jgi:hypothetical protein
MGTVATSNDDIIAMGHADIIIARCYYGPQ